MASRKGAERCGPFVYLTRPQIGPKSRDSEKGAGATNPLKALKIALKKGAGKVRDSLHPRHSMTATNGWLRGPPTPLRGGGPPAPFWRNGTPPETNP